MQIFGQKNMQKVPFCLNINLFSAHLRQIGYSFCNFCCVKWVSSASNHRQPEAELLPIHIARNPQHVAFYRCAPIAHGRVRADIHEGRVVVLCYSAPAGIKPHYNLAYDEKQ